MPASEDPLFAIARSTSLCAEIKDLKRAKQKGKISKSALGVLEKVYAQGERFPNARLIAELSAVNKLRRKDVVQWFEKRRKEQQEDFGVVGPHQ